jgi:hypothetical protein
VLQQRLKDTNQGPVHIWNFYEERKTTVFDFGFVVRVLLDKCGADITITEEIVKAAAGNWRSGREVMTIRLDRHGADFAITEEVVKAAAENSGNCKEVIALLVEQGRDPRPSFNSLHRPNGIFSNYCSYCLESATTARGLFGYSSQI